MQIGNLGARISAQADQLYANFVVRHSVELA